VVLADRLVLTKTDLASAETVQRLKRELARLNPGAALHTATNGELPPSALFGAANLESAAAADRWIALAHASIGEGHGAGPSGGHDHHGTHTHSSDVVCCSLEYPSALRWRELNGWLTAFRIKYGERLLRMKGIVELEGELSPVALHGVHHVFHPPLPLPHLRGKGLSGARLVVIARNIPINEIQNSWNAFLNEQMRMAIS